MAGRVLSRFAAVGVVVGALLGGAWVHGAVAKDEPKYSQSDCDTITSIEVKGSSNGYYGKTAANAAKAYANAARDIEDDQLKAAMLTLSKTWGKVGKLNVISAGKALVKAGKPYNDALTVFTKAQVTCVTESFDTDDSSSDHSSTPTTESDDE